MGVVPVPDERLVKLAEITKTEEKLDSLPPIKSAMVNFVDIAGLVKGASEGAGLGNKFLSHIREVSVIVHVVRAFSDDNVIREGSIDPKSDYETIETELMLADLQSIEKAISNKKQMISKSTLEKVQQLLNAGTSVRSGDFSEEEQVEVMQLFLISAKKELIVLNVSEEDYSEEKIPGIIEKYAGLLGVSADILTVVCAKIEEELSTLTLEEQTEYLSGIGIHQSGLERVIKKAYDTLGLISFLTCGEKEVKAWTIEKGMSAQNAAGVIHTDFIKKFIKAEIVSFDDFVVNSGWKGSREVGKARLEGRDYVMHDGDVVEFKIGA